MAYENRAGAEIQIELDEGGLLECVVLLVYEVNGKNYIAIQPVEGQDDPESDIYFYGYEEDEEGNPLLSNIEDDDEFDAVVDRFDEYLDELEFQAD
ncbi:MAG: DUF1292 domain-containing protein [Eubacteriales bacterium]|nr:DUF1292 domain-containing protein [Eubacteriales bacterium]